MKYSEKMGKFYEVLITGSVRFEDGIVYKKEEFRHLRDCENSTLAAVHEIKTYFPDAVVSASRTPKEKVNE